ncbi:hypothetical protein JMG10_39670 [Nostoc ellipsosporum NOK]|nr:hypothetical protein [Nostoc ellipsosporum NOK]
MANYPKLPQRVRDAIDSAVHQTIETFGNKLPPKANGLCLYYACLGALICTGVYQQATKDPTVYYDIEAGSISIRATSDSKDTSKAVNFGVNKPCLENGNFHCWIVGLYREKQLIIPNEFIDFTSRFYKSIALELGDQWERNDISNYLWIDNQYDLKELYGISFEPDPGITKNAWKKWDELEFSREMQEHALEIYLQIIKSTH